MDAVDSHVKGTYILISNKGKQYTCNVNSWCFLVIIMAKDKQNMHSFVLFTHTYPCQYCNEY
jgi:argonaute-like protein implicated in RNA metabolism and viral defense